MQENKRKLSVGQNAEGVKEKTSLFDSERKIVEKTDALLAMTDDLI